MADSRNTIRLLSLNFQLGIHGSERGPAALIVGPPGIGKTVCMYDICSQISKLLKKPFVTEIWSGPQLQAEDVAGLPVPDLEEGTTRLLPLRVGEKVLPAGMGLLGIDEMGSISASQEAAFLNLLQGGKLGERELPKEVALVAMMNPEDHASNARGLSAPAANRFLWLDWTLDMHSWTDYMLGGPGLSAYADVLPKDWETKHWPRAKSIVVQYMRKNPEALHRMPPAHDAGKAWPSPRSWYNFTRLMAACMAVGERPTSDLVALAAEGCVGTGDAESLIAWVTEMKMPDPEDLLKTKTFEDAKALMPDRPDQENVALEALSHAACRQDDPKYKERWEKAWSIIGPYFTEKQDVAFNAVKFMAMNVPPDAKMPPELNQIPAILAASGVYTNRSKK